MFERRLLTRILTVAVTLSVIVGVAAVVPGDRVLVVDRDDTGERLLATPVTDGSVVSVEYEHSVEKTRVLDVYTVSGLTLDNTRMEFESYGWGLPAREDVRLEDGVFVFDPDWSGRNLHVKPGRIAGHRLHVDGTTYDLVERSDAKTVTIRVERRSALTVAIDALTP